MPEPHNIFMIGALALAVGMVAAAVEPDGAAGPTAIRAWSSMLARALTLGGGSAMAAALIAAG